MITKAQSLHVNSIIENNQDKTTKELIDIIEQETGISFKKAAVRKRKQRLGIKSPPRQSKPKQEKPKQGIELVSEHVAYNWSTKTVITNLGQWGNYICNFDQHYRIMRRYSDEYEGKGDTQAQIAMEFDFPHAKAVASYMRHHGMTKSMIGQTDLEFMQGLTEDEAVDENLQAIKRRVTKKTEKQKWKLTQKWADNWVNFEDNTLEPFKEYLNQLSFNYESPKLDQSISEHSKPFAAVVGLSDFHYMSLIYDSRGKVIYNREIARRKIKNHATQLISHILKTGVPEVIYLPTGNDNLHIDNTSNTTTRGTFQETDGIFKVCLDEYFDITMDYIELFSQLAPVKVMNIEGNHDEHVSMVMRVALSKIYRNRDDIEVVKTYYPRIYHQYGRNCIIMSHGHHTGNKGLKSKIHQVIMGEAREMGINMHEIYNWNVFTGHDHVGSFNDLNGNVQYFIMPSLKETDDSYHLQMGYMGRACESAVYLLDKDQGRFGIFYAK